MLALHVGPTGGDRSLLAKIAASLGLIVGVAARYWSDGDAGYASLPSIGNLPPRTARARHRWPSWQPARTASGRLSLFHGWIDNHHDLARRLNADPNDLAALYGAAVDRWGDRADLELEGSYCAIIHDPDRHAVRLSRSALAAPPLHYFQNGMAIGAASVPRALELMGIERQLETRKLVDALYFNPTGDEGFLQGTWRVGLGQVVHLDPAGRRVLRFYDPLRLRLGWRRGDPRELVEECDRLLEDACRMALADSRNPASTLTGGLDSTNVAARLLRLRGPDQGLQTLTFVPLADHGQKAVPYRNLDERAEVEAFAAGNPGITPHFTDNAGIQFDHRLEQLFLAMGTGQTCTAVNFRYHGILAKAAELGCDWVFTAELSGVGFSAPGDWAYGEFLRRGEWERLVEALRADTWGGRTMGRKLLSRAVVPSLPLPLWRAWKALRGQPVAPQNLQIAGLTAQALAEHDATARARAAGVSYERDQYGYRHEWLTDCLARGDIESADWTQAMEQIYEVRMRDVPANRALLEFCLSLPSEMFLREGQIRWLGRELARGIMPEQQRLSRRVGTQYTDWHALLTPRVPEMRAALREARANPDVSFIDFDRLEAVLDLWPAEATLDDEVYFPCAYTLPRALAMIRYVNFMTGRNAAS
ncbi:MAG: asparagine synthase-related protein [Novosphingobium sp.]